MPLGAQLNPTLTQFIERQPVFFVATAGASGRVNVSPKGTDSLRVLAPDRILWISLSGSGNETAGHVLENDRMTLMFCAFDGDALILRTYGTARVLYPRHREWPDLVQHFPPAAGQRQMFDLTIHSVQTSCGTGVPVMEFQHQRADTELIPYYQDMGPEGVADYWRRKNLRTIDGRPTGLFEDP